MANREGRDKCGSLGARLSMPADENSRLAEIEKKGMELLQEFAELDSVNRAVILEWKRKYEKVEVRFLMLEEENSRLAETERKEKEIRERFLELQKESRDVRFAAIEELEARQNSRSIEDEVYVWKKKCAELEGRVLVLEEGKKDLERKCGDLVVRALVFEEGKMEFDRKEAEFREKTVKLECAKRKADDEVDVWKKKCEKQEGLVLMLVEENSLLLEAVKEGESKGKSVEPISSTNEELSKRSSANTPRRAEEDCRLDSGIRRKHLIEVVDDRAKKASGSSCFKAHSGIPPATLHSCDSRKFGGGRNLSTAGKQHTEDSTQRRTEEDCLLDSEKRRKRSIEVVDIDNVGTVNAYDYDEEDGPLVIHRRKKHVETANPGKSCKAHSQMPPASLQSYETGKNGDRRNFSSTARKQH